MSLLFDALNRAQKTEPGHTQENPPASAQIPEASANPNPSPSPSELKRTATANSLLSNSNRPNHNLLGYVLAGLLLLVGAAAWFFYQQSQLTSIAPDQPAIPVAAHDSPLQTASSVAAASNVANAESTTTKLLAIPDSPTGAGKSDEGNAALKARSTETSSKHGKPHKNNSRASGILAGSSKDPLQEGYLSLSQGRLDQAEQHYQQALAQHPHEKDALLGLAVIAQRKQQTQRATDLYQQVLREDLGNTTAAAGLVSLAEYADPVAAESQLKQLIDIKSNAPEFHYALGNVLARQQRWGEAQQSFFRAHELAPNNVLYAYNLAVSLEHLHQPAAALPFYVKALQLASSSGDVTLNRAAIQKRISELQQLPPGTQ
ncbi:MAG: tetratricopeptide repeat protein [Gallionella sp.]|nr:tetratricopeptide repeat protein [Gallionella sp.]MDD4947522.1 tetratricopeptide repeat protein [Gallionella sp.]MDD5611953.1 tetratricopeptide repeat protein [Gallionella sp.]